LLEGKKVNLRIVEKEDLPLLKEWRNSIEFRGEYQSISQETMKDLEKQYEELTEEQWFFIQKKDGTNIGTISHRPFFKTPEIGYAMLPSERGKGCCTEAVKIMVDYLFLSKNTPRIQAHIDAGTRLLKRSSKTQVSRKKERSEKNTSSGENGETAAHSASLGKNGKNRRY
jgi:RimJ/RimL family protein N-acetyltransferase